MNVLQISTTAMKTRLATTPEDLGIVFVIKATQDLELFVKVFRYLSLENAFTCCYVLFTVPSLLKMAIKLASIIKIFFLTVFTRLGITNMFAVTSFP